MPLFAAWRMLKATCSKTGGGGSAGLAAGGVSGGEGALTAGAGPTDCGVAAPFARRVASVAVPFTPPALGAGAGRLPELGAPGVGANGFAATATSLPSPSDVVVMAGLPRSCGASGVVLP